MGETTKYDVAVLGLWWSSNYGSIMTYYSLYRLIESYGYRTVIIDRPGIGPDDFLFTTDGRRFQREHFPVTPVFRFHELGKLNDYAVCFVMGSDQVWNFGICEKYQGAFFLNFAADNKKKLSYAASFGHPGFFAPPQAIEETKHLLERFDGISVRESSAVDLMRDTFGIVPERVLDPVFAVDQKIFDDLMKTSRAAKEREGKKEPFLCTYILDPTEAKREALLYVAGEKNLPMVHMLDGYTENFEVNKKALDLDGIVEDLKVEDWLYYISHCDFLITDSCHGASFAILFGKPFICIGNASRGLPRFESLAGLFHLEKRFIYDAEEIEKRPDLLEPIDYREIHEILKKERKASRKWLKDKLEAPVRNEAYQEPEKSPGMKALLKLYKVLRPLISDNTKAKLKALARRK